MKLFFLKDLLKKITGILIIIAGSLLLFIALYAVVTGFTHGKREDVYLGFVLTGFSAAIIIPGIKLFLSGVRLSRLEENLKQLEVMINTYRRIKISDIAGKFNISVTEAERLLDKAISLGMVKGNIDRTTGEFFIPDSLNEIKKMSFCPNCGAAFTDVILSGETARCQSCGSIFS